MVVVLTNNSKKEFFLQAESEEDAIRKINEMGKKYPKHVQRYVSLGLKLIPANSIAEAKKKFNQFNVLESSGKLGFFLPIRNRP